MKINDINISTYNAKQLTADIQNSNITNESIWLDSSINPLFLNSKFGFKEITISLYLKGTSRDSILINYSKLISSLCNEVILEIDGYSHKFKAILKNTPTLSKTKSKYRYIAELKFEGYEYDSLASATIVDSNSGQIVNSGNIYTPCLLEITSSTSFASDDELVITGFTDKEIKIKNLEADNTLIIDPCVINDSYLTTVNDENFFNNITMYEFPRLKSGNNAITINRDDIEIVAKYYPRFI